MNDSVMGIGVTLSYIMGQYDVPSTRTTKVKSLGRDLVCQHATKFTYAFFRPLSRRIFNVEALLKYPWLFLQSDCT